MYFLKKKIKVVILSFFNINNFFNLFYFSYKKWDVL